MKQIKNPAVILTLLIIIGIAGLWYFNRQHSKIDDIANRIDPPEKSLSGYNASETRSDNQQLARKVEKMDSAISKLTNMVSELSAKLDILPEKNHENETDNGDDAESEVVRKEVTPEEQQQRIQDQIMVLENALYDPTEYDETWADATRTKVEELILDTPELNIAESVVVQCGGALCKVDAVLPSGTGYEEEGLFHVKLLMDLSQDLPRATTQIIKEPDGSTRYVVYMARKGYKLPTESQEAGPDDDS